MPLCYSFIQINNHLSVPVDLYCESSVLDRVSGVEVPEHQLERSGYTHLKKVEAGEVYNVPLLVAYHCPLFVQPSDPRSVDKKNIIKKKHNDSNSS